MEQAALNAKVVIEEAERLTAAGYRGDAARFVEALLLRAITAGWKRIEPPVPLRPERAASPAVQAAAMADIRTTLSNRRTGGTR